MDKQQADKIVANWNTPGFTARAQYHGTWAVYIYDAQNREAMRIYKPVA